MNYGSKYQRKIDNVTQLFCIAFRIFVKLLSLLYIYKEVGKQTIYNLLEIIFTINPEKNYFLCWRFIFVATYF